MNDQYVNKITAELAAERGYRGDYFIAYDEATKQKYKAPTQSAVQRWLREKHNKCFSPIPCRNQKDKFSIVFYTDYPRNRPDAFQRVYETIYDSWEEAMESGIRTALRLIKK
jgi:hypothetical protein